MNLDGLDVFVDVVETRSFTGAARRLSMPLSTVSAKVARLEAALGTTLLHRTTRQVTVTETGQVYYEHCLRALAALAEAEHQIANVQGAPSGILRITAPADITQFLLAEVVTEFTYAYPDVSVDLRITNEKVDLVAEGIDLAVRIGPLRDSTLLARKFRDISAGLYAAPRYIAQFGRPREIADLAQHRLLQMGQLSLHRVFPNFPIAQDMFARSVQISTDDMLANRAFVAQGAGLGVLPDFVAQGAGDESQLVNVLPALTVIGGPIYFVYPGQKFVPPKLKAFIEFASRPLASGA